MSSSTAWRRSRCWWMRWAPRASTARRCWPAAASRRPRCSMRRRASAAPAAGGACQRAAPRARAWFALRTGLRTRITHFGLYGYALLASATARQAIDFALRYRALASPLIGLAFEHRHEAGEAVVFDDPLGLGHDSALRRFVVELQLGTLLAVHRDLLAPRCCRAACACVMPRRRTPRCCANCWAAGGLRLERRRAVLRRRLAGPSAAFASPVNAELARAAAMSCWPRWSTRSTRVRRRRPRAWRRVAAAAGITRPVFPDAATVAERLGLHERSLRRRLRAEGRSFQALRDEMRCTLARDYLRDTQLSTEDIAAALGSRRRSELPPRLQSAGPARARAAKCGGAVHRTGADSPMTRPARLGNRRIPGSARAALLLAASASRPARARRRRVWAGYAKASRFTRRPRWLAVCAVWRRAAATW